MLPSTSFSGLTRSRKRSSNPMSHGAETKVATATPGSPRLSLRSVGKVTPSREAKSAADCRCRMRATRMAFPNSRRADETLAGNCWKLLSVRGVKFRWQLERDN
jgi:hypothetical protein